MRTFTPRAGRRSLAFSLLAIATLGACSDEPLAPKHASPLKPRSAAQAFDPVEVSVTNKSGGTEVGSLRWAASQMTANGGVIHIDPSLAGDTITLGAELYLDYLTIIEGPAPKGITLSGNDQHRVILANQGLVLRNATVMKGNSSDYASAIYSGGLLQLEHVTVRDNRGSDAAIYAERAEVYLENTTISRNVVGTSALRYRNGAAVRIGQSTIAYNAPGAGLSMHDIATPYPGIVMLHNSIVANNGSPQRNCTTTYLFQYLGANISSDWSCGEVGILVADPKLMPLANNGGPGMTHAIPHLSPAFNAGTDCWTTVDQRYVARDAKCDVGAFEFNDFTKVTITIDAAVKLDATGKALLTGTVKCTRADNFRLALELHQDQKVGKNIVDIHSASDIPVSCTTTAKAWSASMGLSPGESFQNGAARATANTFQTAEWVTPASAVSAVKISGARK